LKAFGFDGEEKEAIFTPSMLGLSITVRLQTPRQRQYFYSRTCYVRCKNRPALLMKRELIFWVAAAAFAVDSISSR
jgi:hypothetical protein